MTAARTPRRSRVWTLAIGTLLTGCFSLPEYPRDWPPLQQVKQGDCPTITGSFENQPAATDHVWATDARASGELVLFFFPQAELRTVDHVSFETRPLELDVELHLINGDTIEQVFKSEPQCKDSMLLISQPRSTAVDPLSLSTVSDRESNALGLATDGSLILEPRYSAGGAVVLVPVAAAKRGWLRYEPFNAGTDDNSEKH
jgi:hypothetical protein